MCVVLLSGSHVSQLWWLFIPVCYQPITPPSLHTCLTSTHQPWANLASSQTAPLHKALSLLHMSRPKFILRFTGFFPESNCSILCDILRYYSFLFLPLNLIPDHQPPSSPLITAKLNLFPAKFCSWIPFLFITFRVFHWIHLLHKLDWDEKTPFMLEYMT